MIIKKLPIVNREDGEVYKEPPSKGLYEITVSNSGNPQKLDVVIQAVQKEWGPNGFRIEGYTVYKHHICKVIGDIRIDTTSPQVGSIEIFVPQML